MCVSHSVMSDALRLHGRWPTRLLCPRSSLGKNTGVGCHSLLQGIYSTQGSNLDLLHCGQILYHLSHQSHEYTFPLACPSLRRELFLPISIFNLVKKKKIRSMLQGQPQICSLHKNLLFLLRLRSYSVLHYRHSISEMSLFLL